MVGHLDCYAVHIQDSLFQRVVKTYRISADGTYTFDGRSNVGLVRVTTEMNSLGIHVYNMYLLHSTGIEYYHYGENGQERFLGVRASFSQAAFVSATIQDNRLQGDNEVYHPGGISP